MKWSVNERGLFSWMRDRIEKGDLDGRVRERSGIERTAKRWTISRVDQTLRQRPKRHSPFNNPGRKTMAQSPSIKVIKVFQDPVTKMVKAEKIHVSPGDQIAWDNQTGSKIDILIPDHGIMKMRHIPHGHGQTPPDQQPTVEMVPVDPNAPTKYRYAIYVHGTRDFAAWEVHIPK